MAVEKSASVEWKGTELDFHAELGSGYGFEMSGPATPTGGSPVEFMLAGVAGCTAMDIVHILRKRRLSPSNITVEIRGTQAEEAPNVYTDANIVYIIRGENITPAVVEKAIELSQDKYCSASIMFQRAGVHVTTEYRIEEMVTA